MRCRALVVEVDCSTLGDCGEAGMVAEGRSAVKKNVPGLKERTSTMLMLALDAACTGVAMASTERTVSVAMACFSAVFMLWFERTVAWGL